MNKHRPLVGSSLAALAVVLAGCGYVGDPLPPVLNIPVHVTDLRAVERGDRVVVEFTASRMTTEGLLLKQPAEVELRAGPGTPGSFDIQKWLAGTTRIEVAKPEFGAVHIETPARVWVGKEILLAVRLINAKGRTSEWSNLVALPVVEPLAPPAGLRAEAVAQGVRLSWQTTQARAGAAVRILRKAPAAQQFVAAGRAEGNQWIDPDTHYGARYEYRAQIVLKTGASEAESLETEPVALVPVDRFPPAVPSALIAAASPDGIELTWERNTEIDLAGYYVYRAVAGGAFQKIGDLLAAPSFSDRKLESGKRYSYAVSAVDQTGNESARTPAAEITAP